jgi:hypothetical protein
VKIPMPATTASRKAPRLDTGHFVAQGRDSPRPNTWLITYTAYLL